MFPAVKRLKKILKELPAEYGIWVRQFGEGGKIIVGFNTGLRAKCEGRRNEILVVLTRHGISAEKTGTVGTVGEFGLEVHATRNNRETERFCGICNRVHAPICAYSYTMRSAPEFLD